MSRRHGLVALGLAALLASACGDDTVTTPSLPSPTTSDFSSQLVVSGSSSRSFTATKNGTVVVTLDEAGPAGTVVGLGIGVPFNGVSGCALNKAITATAATIPHLAEAVEAGRYCVAIFDTGTLTSTINFKMTIVFP
jgi:hypothetical protein